MAISSGVCLLASVTIFPESVGHSFRAKFPRVLEPLSAAVQSVEELFVRQANDTPLSTDIDDSQDLTVQRKLSDWADKSKAIRVQLLSSLAGLPPLRAQLRYLPVDISYSRLSSDHLRELFEDLAVLQARSSGLAFFFDILVSNARHSHLDSSVYTVRAAMESRPGSRPASIRNDTAGDGDTTPEPTEAHERSYVARHLPEFLSRRSSPAGFGLRGSHTSLLEGLRKAQQPVGVYESQRYMELEKAFDK